MENESIEVAARITRGPQARSQRHRILPLVRVLPKGEKEEQRREGRRRWRRKTAATRGMEGITVGVMQEQKAENTGRQFCSCFYQLLGIGGSGPTMPGRILGGSCGNVRLFSVLPLLLPPNSVPFYPCSFSRGPFLARLDGSSFPAWLSFFLCSLARRLVSLPFVLPTLSTALHLVPLLQPPLHRTAASGTKGYRGHPPRCTRLRGVPYIYAR